MGLFAHECMHFFHLALQCKKTNNTAIWYSDCVFYYCFKNENKHNKCTHKKQQETMVKEYIFRRFYVPNSHSMYVPNE